MSLSTRVEQKLHQSPEQHFSIYSTGGRF